MLLRFQDRRLTRRLGAGIFLSLLAIAFLVRGLVPIHGDLHQLSHRMADHGHHQDVDSAAQQHAHVHDDPHTDTDTGAHGHSHGVADASLAVLSDVHNPGLAHEHLGSDKEPGHDDGSHSLMHEPGTAQMFSVLVHQVDVLRIEFANSEPAHLPVSAALGGDNAGVFRPPIPA